MSGRKAKKSEPFLFKCHETFLSAELQQLIRSSLSVWVKNQPTK